MRASKINEAVRNCLADIYGRAAILARIEESLDNLRAKAEFSQRELREVETAVRKDIRSIHNDTSRGNCHVAIPGPSLLGAIGRNHQP